ncbi:nucleotidyltransferase family protein [Actinoplanes sp. NPDC049316]|uniref:nucleotidyltransferase family protein n=1 Tax=Actinoplanes sp. NPDC049316 TaxID=3154727 RepID=UPI003418209E
MNATGPVQTFFPDTTDRPRVYRLLRAASEPAHRELGEMPGPDDIDPLGEVLEYVINAKMTCLFADWLSRHDHTQGFPRPMQQFLRGQLRLNAYRSLKHHQEAAAIITALHDHDVPAAAINGIAHATLLYPGAGVRQSSDVDILIPASAASTAADLLTRRGYYSTGRSPTTLHRDFDDPIVPGLTLDLTTRLAHTGDDTTIQTILQRRAPAPGSGEHQAPLPILHRDDGFRHTLARVASQRRWPAVADALHYALDDTGPQPATALDEPSRAGWDLVRSCWPQLPQDVPLGRDHS